MKMYDNTEVLNSLGFTEPDHFQKRISKGLNVPESLEIKDILDVFSFIELSRKEMRYIGDEWKGEIDGLSVFVSYVERSELSKDLEEDEEKRLLEAIKKDSIEDLLSIGGFDVPLFTVKISYESKFKEKAEDIRNQLIFLGLEKVE